MRFCGILGLLCLPWIPACASTTGADDPEAVVRAFHEARREGNFERALHYISPTVMRGGDDADRIEYLRNEYLLIWAGRGIEVHPRSEGAEEASVEVRSGRFLRLYALVREPEGWRIRWWLDGTSPAWSEPELRLPWAASAPVDTDPDRPQLVVSVTADGRTFVEGVALDPARLRERLDRFAAESPATDPAHVLLRVERTVPWRDVAKLFEEAAAAGLFAVSAATSVEYRRGEPTSPRTEGTLSHSWECRLCCYLPRGQVPRNEVGLVLDVGAAGFEESVADSLEGLRGEWPDPDRQMFLINARPETPWREVVRAADVLYRMDLLPLFATPGSEPPERGLRVSEPKDHPAVTRIIHAGR